MSQSKSSSPNSINTMLAAVFQSPLKKDFYDKLPYDKININWNKKAIAMDLFLSFLQVEVKRSNDHLGLITGWTLLYNNELKLQIGGGIVKGTEYLDSLQFGTKLSNPYNNYVNPFYLFEILNNEGRVFFVDYYKDEIKKIVLNYKDDISYLKKSLSEKTETLQRISLEIETLSANSR